MLSVRTTRPAPASPKDEADEAVASFSVTSWSWYGFMMALAVVVAAALSGLHRGISGDALWHLADGRWILAHQRIPRTNPFGWSTGSTPWINLEWGWDIASAGLVAALGTPGLGLWLLAMVGVIAWSQHRRWNALGIRPLAQGDWIFLTLVLTSAAWAWRPQLVSYALFPLWCGTLEFGSRNPRRWWWLVPELLVWQTFHGGYLIGLMAWIIWIGEALWPRLHPHALDVPQPLPWRTILGVTGAMALTLGLTPWGWGGFGHAVWESLNPVISRSITEWQSPNFHVLWWAATIGGPVVAIGGWIYAHPESRLGVSRAQWLIWALCLGGTMLAIRQVPFYFEQTAIIGAGIGLWHPQQRTPPLRGRWMVLVLAVLGFAITPEIQAWFTPHVGIPPAMVRVLRRHPGRIVNGYRAGDGLVSLGIADSLDGRTDLFVATPHDWFLQSESAESGAWPWPRLSRWLQAYDVRYVLWPTSRGGSQEMAGRAGVTQVDQQHGLTLFRIALAQPRKG